MYSIEKVAYSDRSMNISNETHKNWLWGWGWVLF